MKGREVAIFGESKRDEFLLESKGQIATSGTFRENAIARFLPVKKRNFQVQALQAPFKWRGMQIYSKKLVDFCKLNDLQLHIWTVNSLDNLKICLDGKYSVLCKKHLLTVEQKRLVDKAERAENLKICVDGKYSVLCKKELLTSSQKKMVDQAEKAENFKFAIVLSASWLAPL